MVDDPLYIPFPRALYDDLVRRTRLDPAKLAEEQVRQFCERALAEGDRHVFLDEEAMRAFAEAHFAGHLAMRRQTEGETYAGGPTEVAPLVWREVAIPHGSEVRMRYEGRFHHAEVRDGAIVDRDGAWTPYQWARKVAGGAKRNPWRDLWFRKPGAQVWARAQTLRNVAGGGEALRPTPFDDLEEPLDAAE